MQRIYKPKKKPKNPKKMLKNYYFKGTLFTVLFCSMLTTFGQTKSQRTQITKEYNTKEIKKLSSSFLEKQKTNKKAAITFAKANNIPVSVTLNDGGFAELQKVNADGSLLYYRTFNVAAARSTRTNYLNTGGGLGLSVDGQNMTAYVWDGGHARVTHQEYDGVGGTNRVSVEDASTEGGTQLNFHAAHVTGTICASGFAANAKGMAAHSKVKGYMWNNDLSEATTEAANGMLVSNHSYGYRSKDDAGNNILPNYFPGAYIEDSRDWDNLMYNAPNYLMVVAAGNDGSQSITANPLATGFDKLTGHSTSKNNLVVANAQDATIDSAGNLVSVVINSSSSQGPTDDLRIKPDIAGNGTGVYSSYQNSDSAYGTISGTSMASPNVAGSLLLLQQHHRNVKGSFMRSASLRGLALHTADDAGLAGPDPVFGWGLMNAKRAAETITNTGNSSIISELTLQPGQTYTINVNSDGVNKLLASICWTDPTGTATTALNSSSAILINDLDIRITKSSSVFSPWRLTGVNTNGTGDNTKDNFERVDVTGATGQYTITVTHKGTTLSGGSQNYTLIVTGVTTNVVTCNATVPTNLASSAITTTGATVSWGAVTGTTYEYQYKTTAATAWTTGTSASASVSLTGLTASTAYQFQVKSICPNNTSSAFSASLNFTTANVPAPTYCTSTSTNTTDERIARVQLGTINNASTSTTGYENFTSLSTNLTRGTANTITITPFWRSTRYAEGYSVWIDYNSDGDFTDAGEQVFTRTATTTTPVAGTFTVPAATTTGPKRVRVSMKYNAVPTACESFTYGQVEDYTVNIVASGVVNAITSDLEIDGNKNNYDFAIYPNPTKGILNISSFDNRAVSYVIYSLIGKKIISGNAIETGIDVSEIPSGIYVIELNDGKKTVSKKFVKN